MSGRYDSRHDRSDRHSSSGRRDSSPSRSRRDNRSSRSSPGPSRRSSPPRSDRLPEQFGRVAEKREEDDSSVLQLLKKSYDFNPLGALAKCMDGTQTLKVWTRNYKEVRGICTGKLVVFDKHWNMVLTDVSEVYLKPKKCKTPYLNDLRSTENLPELPPRKPKQKKTAEEKEAAKQAAEAKAPPAATEAKALPTAAEAEAPPAAAADESGDKSKKKKKRKKKSSTPENRVMKQCFIRGDNIVMVAIMSEPADEEDGLEAQDTNGSRNKQADE